MNTCEEADIPTEIPFETMASVGRYLVLEACEKRFTSEEGFARAARLDLQEIREFLWNPSFSLLDGLTGKQWARLISAAGILPEDWVGKAAGVAEKKATSKLLTQGSVPQYLNSASGCPPSEALERKIKLLLSITDSFYFNASEKYAERHGRA